ncbi:MAG: glycosyl hydrolase, partial [Myxococcales bacterium]|nr:glycosyl hydrolase [Myxococcales bacterium]
LALGLVLTLPGVPVVYYGDELGLGGGADPDNRRVMPDLAALPAGQQRALELVRRVARARRCVAALRRGARRALVVGRDQYAFVRDAQDGAPAVVLLWRDAVPGAIALPPGSTSAPGWYKDVLTGQRLELGPEGTSVPMDPRSLRVLVPEASPCN